MAIHGTGGLWFGERCGEDILEVVLGYSRVSVVCLLGHLVAVTGMFQDG